MTTSIIRNLMTHGRDRRWIAFPVSVLLTISAIASSAGVRGALPSTMGTSARLLTATGGIMAMKLTSNAFAPGADIPVRFTCSGEDVSPGLTWTDGPAGTQSFALIMDDPDAPSGTFTHWVLFDLPPQTRQLRENVSKAEELPGGGRQGRNDFRRVGYGGPCPPPGKPHRYFFKLYALDSKLNLKPGATKGEVEAAMKGHILQQADLIGKFKR
jgi:Raf kinase inhibitor-like YbhB/YbcL family protein